MLTDLPARSIAGALSLPLIGRFIDTSGEVKHCTYDLSLRRTRMSENRDSRRWAQNEVDSQFRYSMAHIYSRHCFEKPRDYWRNGSTQSHIDHQRLRGV